MVLQLKKVTLQIYLVSDNSILNMTSVTAKPNFFSRFHRNVLPLSAMNYSPKTQTYSIHVH